MAKTQKQIQEWTDGEVAEHASRGLTMEEQETVITWNRASAEVNVYTADPYLMRRLDKSSEYEAVREHRQGGTVVAKDYRTDKKMILVREKRVTREMTDEQKKALADRMKARLAGNDKA